jgi:hypothetical protein
MPQNWWEFFPEVQASPFASPRPMPGPGAAMPVSAAGAKPSFPAVQLASREALAVGDRASNASDGASAGIDESYSNAGPESAKSAVTRRAGVSPPSRAPSPPLWRPGGDLSVSSVEGLADDAMRAYKIHVARGMTPEQAAGWAANVIAESHDDYRLHQRSHGPGYGLFQWGSDIPSLDRRPNFKKVFGHSIYDSSEREQYEFRDWELAHNYAPAARRIGRETSAGDIALAITDAYEHPAHWQQRAIDRANIAEAIMRRVRQMPDVVSPNGSSADPWQRGISASGSGPVR